MSPKLAHANATIEALEMELHRPGHLPGTRGLFEDARIALAFALDEIAQAHEDRNKAVKLAVKLSARVAELEDELTEHEHADLLAEQRLDYMWDAQ